MNRFLTSATAMTLGLASCGNSMADDRTKRPDPYALQRTTECERDMRDYFRSWFQYDAEALQYFDDWWIGPDDLRHFDYGQADYCLHHSIGNEP